MHYFLQTIAFQVFFLLIYDVFLRRETFFNCNRVYLLLTTMLSLGLPFVKFNSIKAIVPQQFIIRLPEVIIGETVAKPSVIDSFFKASSMAETTMFTWSWSWFFYLGIGVATLFFVFKLVKILRLLSKNPKRWKGNFLIVKLLDSNAAFSFFNYIFLGERIQPQQQQVILDHELVHVTQKHSLDLLFFEIIRILFWCNPLVYIYQNRITELHEFIADDKAINHHNKSEYYQKLLSQIFDTQEISFINSFFNQSLIKKRLVMLSKSKSKQINLLKYTLLLPVIFGMLMYTSSYAEKSSYESKSQTSESILVQDLSDRALYDKYYNEILEKIKEDDFESILKEYFIMTDNYIKSRENFYKESAFLKYVSTVTDSIVEEKVKEMRKTSKEEVKKKNQLRAFQAYKEYLKYKKTDSAKLNWESRAKDGVLRLVVDDFKKMTTSEQKRYDKKVNMIKNDDYFYALLITDGKTTSTMAFETVDSKKITKNYEIVKVLEVEEREALSDQLEVPFSVIEEVPTFSFCDDLKTNKARKACMSNNIAKHVNKNFNTDIAVKVGLTGRQRINVIFKITIMRY